MPDIGVVNGNNEKIEVLNLNDKIFGIKPNEHVVHEAVVMQLASLRQGTASSKTRGNVSLSGKKPWRQKGTGRARVGTASSPIWRGGGVVFGPHPRNYGYSINKKKRRLALLSVLSSKIMNSSLIVIDKIELEGPKTKLMKKLLANVGLEGKILIVAGFDDENLLYSTRNIPYIKLVSMEELNTFDIINADKLLITKSELLRLKERFE